MLEEQPDPAHAPQVRMHHQPHLEGDGEGLGQHRHQGGLPLAAIWLAHVGFDRALGYGLKYARGFSHTHLGTIGKTRREELRAR